MKKTYQGSCQCGKVRFEADIDLNAGTRQCHCWICSRAKVWETLVEPEDFRLLAGEAELSNPPFGARRCQYRVCRTCGVASFGRGYRETTGGEYVSIAAACLDAAQHGATQAAQPVEARGRRAASLSASSASP